MPSALQDPARIVLILVPMILSLTVHEFAHAWTAHRFGDDTAQRQGRLTLNPLVHIDWIGTVLMTVLGALSGVPLLGWAKPVPVDPTRFRTKINHRTAFTLVSLAGPFSNLALALLSALLLSRHVGFVAHSPGVSNLLLMMLLMNTGLFVFNMLPIPPLDGSRMLPRRFDGLQARVRPYGNLVLLAIVMVPPLQHALLYTPVTFLVGLMARAFGPLG